MNLVTILIVTLVAAAFLAAIFAIHRSSKKGSGCDGCSLRHLCRK